MPRYVLAGGSVNRLVRAGPGFGGDPWKAAQNYPRETFTRFYIYHMLNFCNLSTQGRSRHFPHIRPPSLYLLPSQGLLLRFAFAQNRMLCLPTKLTAIDKTTLTRTSIIIIIIITITINLNQTSSPWAVTLSWQEFVRWKCPTNVQISTQNYKSLSGYDMCQPGWHTDTRDEQLLTGYTIRSAIQLS